MITFSVPHSACNKTGFLGSDVGTNSLHEWVQSYKHGIYKFLGYPRAAVFPMLRPRKVPKRT